MTNAILFSEFHPSGSRPIRLGSTTSVPAHLLLSADQNVCAARLILRVHTRTLHGKQVVSGHSLARREKALSRPCVFGTNAPLTSGRTHVAPQYSHALRRDRPKPNRRANLPVWSKYRHAENNAQRHPAPSDSLRAKPYLEQLRIHVTGNSNAVGRPTILRAAGPA
jgi:hypothetical protein